MANIGEMPSLSSHVHATSTYSGADFVGVATAALNQQQMTTTGGYAGGLQAANVARGKLLPGAPMPRPPKEFIQAVKEKDMGRRYVQIFLADPDPRVPIDKCLIHTTDPKMTELDDKELFFDIDVRRLVDHYNETVRTKVVDKTVKDREVFLEPVRIRDLAMNVTTIAKFGG